MPDIFQCLLPVAHVWDRCGPPCSSERPFGVRGPNHSTQLLAAIQVHKGRVDTYLPRLCRRPLYLQVYNIFSTELHQHSICLNVFEYIYFCIHVQYDLPIPFQCTLYIGIGTINLRELDIM